MRTPAPLPTALTGRWVNEARDTLSCEVCGARLLFPQNTPHEVRARAAELFADQLSQRHDSTCPWRHTRCDDSVLAFDPRLLTPPTSNNTSTSAAGTAAQPMDVDAAATHAALSQSYHDRLSKLEKVDLLPDVYPRALQQLAAQADSPALLHPAAAAAAAASAAASQPPRPKGWGSEQLRKVLALPAPAPPGFGGGSTPGGAGAIPPGFDPSTPIVLPAKLSGGQKARLLALLGWDAEALPADSPDLALLLGPPSGAAGGGVYRPSSEPYGLAHLVGTPPGGGGGRRGSGAGGAAAAAGEEEGQGRRSGGGGKERWSMEHVVLTCPNCK